MLDYNRIIFIYHYTSWECDPTAWYNVKVREYDDELWYTATFTDPCTNEQFASGLGNIVNVKSRTGSTLKTPLYKADVKVLDGVVYYNDKKLAKHAAAARAIDCYLLREQCVDGIRLCLEDPYITAEDGVSQSVDYDALLLQKNELLANDDDNYTITDTMSRDNFIEGGDIRSSKVQGGLPMSSSINKSFSYSVQNIPHQLHVPMRFISEAYVRVPHVKYVGDATACYNVEEREYDNELWYTATFTDPYTNEQFASGLGNIVNIKSRPGRTLKTPLYIADVKVIDGVVYYNDKKLAKHAAAARAIDCYLLREQCVDGIRLCLEDPYITAEDGVSQSVDYDVLLLQKDELLANDDHDTITGTMPMESFIEGGSISSFARLQPHHLHIPLYFLGV